jgi:GR25 family glycosyltransferase involved in LPS biosynthesis
MNIIKLIYLLIFILILIISLKYLCNSEDFTNSNFDNDIDYYVIHLKDSSPERKENILMNQKILGKKINIFDAVNGKEVDLNNLQIFDKNINFNFDYYSVGEVGCYLSHLMLYKKIMESKKKYTVIFEDDFIIENNDIHTKIHKITNDVNDFDIVYLGNTYDNYDIDNKISENIYTPKLFTKLYGAHALLINNKYINKIYNYLIDIDRPIDIKLQDLINETKLKGYVYHPILVSQDNIKFKSQIRSELYTYFGTLYRKFLKIF